MPNRPRRINTCSGGSRCSTAAMATRSWWRGRSRGLRTRASMQSEKVSITSLFIELAVVAHRAWASSHQFDLHLATHQGRRTLQSREGYITRRVEQAVNLRPAGLE